LSKRQIICIGYASINPDRFKKTRFGIRLFDAIGGAGTLTLLTDGSEIYARTAQGEFYNLLRAPSQPATYRAVTLRVAPSGSLIVATA